VALDRRKIWTLCGDLLAISFNGAEPSLLRSQ
jgi:hypothetical protein